MFNLQLEHIAHLKFQANPAYRLIALADLPSHSCTQLGDLGGGANFYGFLYPKAKTGLGIKSICAQTARLYQFLKTPSTLPNHLLMQLGDEANRLIAKLVVDSVIQLETSKGFVSGALACSELFPTLSISTGDGIDEGDDISQAALLYAQTLRLENPQELSSRLYFYNRIPASSYWCNQIPDLASVKQFLGISPGTLVYRTLQQDWMEYEVGNTAGGWLVWSSKAAAVGGKSAQDLIYKLYINPTCEALPAMFSRVVECLTHSRASHFKVGKDCYGLLRPDKLIAYFADFQDLLEVAEVLKGQLRDTPVHAVPFTASLDKQNLLTWGIDPPASDALCSLQDSESWRFWITNQLAVGMIAAQQSSAKTVKPWQFALARLQIEGVDIHTWQASDALWRWQKSPMEA